MDYTTIAQALVAYILLAPLLNVFLATLSLIRGPSCPNKELLAYISSASLSLGALAAIVLGWLLFRQEIAPIQLTGWSWLQTPGLQIQFNFQVDWVTAVMLVVVNFVSALVHFYSLAYMRADAGLVRFFAYISGFTAAMLVLVTSTNLLQLFFAWEAVGLCSYLLIGFWHYKPSAVKANLKAFVVNRVGDAGFLLALALLYKQGVSLDYAVVLNQVASLQHIELLAGCFLLAAMAKSAQIPLHLWLPDSMEGPTPISALIHAATMVTAGIFLVLRLQPLFSAAPMVSNCMLVIGAITALSMGMVAIVELDLKRIIAYSTLSQLGYMMAALGAGGYTFALFHIATHAAFKALLFLIAGVIIFSHHHEQNILQLRGSLRSWPVLAGLLLIASLALLGWPGTSGFFSKDLILELVAGSALPLAKLVQPVLLVAVVTTTMYSARLVLLLLDPWPRQQKSSVSSELEQQSVQLDSEFTAHAHEKSYVELNMIWPLFALAVPSLLLGWLGFNWLHANGVLAFSLNFYEAQVLAKLPSAGHLVSHSWQHLSFWLIVLGLAVSLLTYLEKVPSTLVRALVLKSGFDSLLQQVLKPLYARLTKLGASFVEQILIDKILVHSWVSLAQWFGQLARGLQAQTVAASILQLLFLLSMVIIAISIYAL